MKKSIKIGIAVLAGGALAYLQSKYTVRNGKILNTETAGDSKSLPSGGGGGGGFGSGSGVTPPPIVKSNTENNAQTGTIKDPVTNYNIPLLDPIKGTGAPSISSGSIAPTKPLIQPTSPPKPLTQPTSLNSVTIKDAPKSSFDGFQEGSDFVEVGSELLDLG